MTATTEITAALAPIFAELDAKVLAESLTWIEERAAAVHAFQQSDEYRKMDVYSRYDRVFALAGGKSWYQVISVNGSRGRAAHMTKHCAKVAEKRNATIANKLIKAEVTEVTGSDIARSHDGFNGVFRVATNKGPKRVTIDTIYAGGYNIQCLHLRVLVHVK